MDTVPSADSEFQKSRPSREDRKNQILCAALNCVKQSGFHGASMSNIAAEADMSVGVIYRYFENKEAIIEAIVANDLAEMRAKFAEWEALPDEELIDTLLDVLGMAIEHKCSAAYAAVALEVLAEAARNPRVAAIVQSADREERELSRTLCNRMSGNVSSDMAAAQGEVMSMLFEGMVCRAVSNPDMDREAVLKVLRQVVRFLITQSGREDTADKKSPV